MFQCGYKTGTEYSLTRSSWSDTGARPLDWSVWYPTDCVDGLKKASNFFDLEDAFQEPPIAGGVFPVVLMSHGTGGSAEGMAWIASFLAKRGFVVIGANHHGNTSMAEYQPEGFLCWWERAEDLSELLTYHLGQGPFAKSLDVDRVSALGFSLGGYTAMALAGAITRFENFLKWRGADGIGAAGPTEFPDAEDHIPSLIESSKPFRTSWQNASRDFTDERIKALVLLAPAPPVRGFEISTVEKISLPTLIVSASGDVEAPKSDCGDWLERINPNFEHDDIGDEVNHYTFLSFPARKELIERVHIFQDHPSVDRQKVHSEICERVLPALA